MGLRFNKRIKLGKGLGLNISKSGVSLGYRTKRGSVSTRGYSIKTGIPGLTYRKTFNKNKGCLLTLIVLIVTSSILTIGSCTSETSSSAKQWYQGGTLHRSKITDWKLASKQNKLATCGDFCANAYKNRPIEEIKLIAANLVICIDESIKGHNTADDTYVSEMASICLIFMEN